jgi:hypothetical protein
MDAEITVLQKNNHHFAQKSDVNYSVIKKRLIVFYHTACDIEEAWRVFFD